jgi:hypothetical protein
VRLGEVDVGVHAHDAFTPPDNARTPSSDMHERGQSQQAAGEADSRFEINFVHE